MRESLNEQLAPLAWRPISQIFAEGSKVDRAIGRHQKQEDPLMPSGAAAHQLALSDDIKAFRHYLQAERGMAVNTVLAYGRDLDRFALWVGDGGLTDFLNPS